jgi:universal stress protein E
MQAQSNRPTEASAAAIRRILVAVKDPRRLALPAVAKAARLARACGAQLELFHAIKASVWAANSRAYESAVLDLGRTHRQQLLWRLDRIAARLRLHGIKVSTAVEYDYPSSDAIIRRAREISADLIVASRSRASDLLLRSPIPVLVVKPSGPYRHPTVLAAVDPEHAHGKPSDLDQQILRMGQQIASALRGRLHTVHAYAPVVMGGAALGLEDRVKNQLHDIAAADARVRFDAVLQESHIALEHQHLVGDLPAAAIDQVARRIDARIVVIGAVSRSGLGRLLIGHTAQRLLNESTCDLLIVKPRNFTCRVPALFKGPRVYT